MHVSDIYLLVLHHEQSLNLLTAELQQGTKKPRIKMASRGPPMTPQIVAGIVMIEELRVSAMKDRPSIRKPKNKAEKDRIK